MRYGCDVFAMRTSIATTLLLCSFLFTVVALVASLAAEVPEDSVFEQEFGSSSGGEATAVIHASCARCAWGERGREAAAVRISIDGAYSQHLLLARGA